MNEKIRYFSMFTGVGGFELGIQQATSLGRLQQTDKEGQDSRKFESTRDRNNKWECIGFSEIDKYASQLLTSKFPTIKNYGDATKIIPRELPDFQLLVGGFPCQAFSIAGKRRGFEDTRGTLFHEIVRILEVKRPKHILLENVKGLLSHDRGRTFAIILASLSKLGYVIQWMVLNSKFFGVPQNRERVFIIGSVRGEPIPEILPLGRSSQKINEQQSRVSFPTVFSSQHKIARGMPMIQRMQFDVSGKGYNSQQDRLYFTGGVMGTLPNANPDNKLNIAIPILTPDRPEKRQNGRRFKEDGDPSFTLTGQDIHGVAILSHSPRTNDVTKGGSGPLISEEHSFTIDRTPHKVIMGTVTEAVGSRQVSSKEFISSVEKVYNETMKIRRLTPIECERLQGFPDGWTEGFSDTQRYKMMGNAVTVNVVKAIAEKLTNYL